jgi:hypothetical protein
MPTPTYVPITSYKVTNSTSSVTISSIPQSYRDIVIVIRKTANQILGVRFNGDTGSSYIQQQMQGGPSVPSARVITGSYIYAGLDSWAGLGPVILNVMDYSTTDKRKGVLVRANASEQGNEAMGARWNNTSAINSITILGDPNILPTTQISLYGISA